LGNFAVIPFLNPYLVANVGVPEEQLPYMYLAGGALTLGSAPLIGWLADRYGKLLVFRVVAPLSAVMCVVVTHLPQGVILAAVFGFAMLMVANSGRMIAAMAMITGSVQPRRRGGFLSANASVQHIAAGVGASMGGHIVAQAGEAAPLEHYGVVGWIACAITLASVWLAGRVRLAEQEPVAAEPLCLAAAAEATADAGEPMIGA
jgi:DHA1 family inner membrane transport protein